MIKKTIIFAVLSLVIVTPVFAGEVKGWIFQNTKEYLVGTNIIPTERRGQSACTEVFTLVAVGDCSVSKAMQNGDIKSLSHADRQIIDVLGIRRVKVTAYGN